MSNDDFDPLYYDIDDGEPNEYETALMECGMGQDGYCELAGTEHCDWDCPIQEMLVSKRKRVTP